MDTNGYGGGGIGTQQMQDDDELTSGTLKNTKNVPDCTKKYYPTLGGQEGSNWEGESSLGAITIGPVGTEPTGNKEIGNYEEGSDHYPSWVFHAPEDPQIGGPPLAYTPLEDPNKSQY